MKGILTQHTSHKDSTVIKTLLGLLLSTLFLHSQVHASDFDFGSISGEFSAQGGAATYNIPIQIPAGVAGMQPELSLAYSSHGGASYLGLGWSLQGLTAIYRCPKTEAQDGVKGSIHFDENDRYCMNGQRLVAVNGAYGAPATEYKTEIDSFSRITSVDGTPESGPKSWIVESKAGQKIELGATDDSRMLTPRNSRSDVIRSGDIKISWQVNKISDAVGNQVNFIYYNYRDSGQIYPKTIEYSDNRVEFVYENRPEGDQYVSYLSGVKTAITKRLEQIDTYRQTQKVRSYIPAYEIVHTTWQSRIKSIEECAGDGTCLPETHFDYESWEPSSLPYENKSILAENSFTHAHTWSTTEHLRLLSDVDGDGVADIVGFGDHGVDVKLASGESFTRLSDFGRLTNLDNPDHEDWVIERHLRMMADVNADGKADIVGFGDHGVYYALSQGTSFSPRVTWIENQFGYNKNTAGGWRINQHPRMLGDVDGDNRPDVVGISETHVEVVLASGKPFGREGLWNPGTWYGLYAFGDKEWDMVRNPRHLVDVNGDGRADVLGFGNDGVLVAFSEGDHFTQPVKMLNAFVQEDPEEVAQRLRTWLKRELADVNGDGMLDIVGFAKDGVHVSLSTGMGFLEPEKWIDKFGKTTGELYATYRIDFPSSTNPDESSETVNGWDLDKHIITLADMNGDGRADIVGFADDGVYASASLGTGFSEPVKIHEGFTSFGVLTNPGGYKSEDHLRMVADVNGDGLADIVGFHEDNVEVAYNHFTHVGDVTQITSGSGVKIDVAHKSIAGPNEHYSKGSSAREEFGELDIQIPIRVVTSVTTSNGLLDGTNSLSYRYGDMRVNKRGRGPQGFGWFEVKNEQSGVVSRTELFQRFPHTGTVRRTLVLSPDEKPLSRSVTDLGPFLSSAPEGTVYRILPNTISSIEFDLNGDEVKKSDVKNERYDDYGNLTLSTITITGGGETFVTRTENIYQNDTESWHLGRLSRSVVERTQKRGGVTTDSATHTSAFEYNPATGLLSKEIIEPDDPTLIQSTEYTYDNFGNKTRSVTTGAGLTEPRSSETKYTPDGRFPSYSKNALGHTENYRYHNICGKKTWLKGPNNGVTQWTYDAFCRQTSEKRHDGTQTTTERFRILDATQHETIPAGWPTNIERYPLANVHYKYVTRETGKPPVTVYYDQLGRGIRTETLGMNNQIIYQDTEYNEIGEVARASRRYFAGDPIYWITTRYDILGRTTLINAPADHGGRALTKTLYDGLKTTTVDAKGRTTIVTRDALDRVVRTDQPEGAFVINRYDAYDNLIETEDAKGNAVKMVYNGRGQKIAMDDPDMGHWEYRYNTLGELLWQKDAEDQVVTMEYDVLGRMVSRSEAEGETVWTYDNKSYGKGKLGSVTAPGGYSDTMRYDRYGRPQTVNTIIDGKTYTVSNEYDPVTGLITRERRPNGFVVDNVYDDNGYLIAKRTPAQMISDYESAHLRSLAGVALTSAREALERAEHYAVEAADFESWAETFQTEVAQEAETQELAQPVAGLQRHKPYKLFTHSSTGELYLESPEQILILRRKINTPIRVTPKTHYKVIVESDGRRSLEAIDAQTFNSSILPSLSATGEFVFFGDYNADGQTDYLVRNQSEDALYTSEQLERLGAAANEISTVAEILWDLADDALSAATQLIAIAGRVDDRMRQDQLWAENLDGDDIQKMVVNGGNVVYWQANTRDAELRLTGYRQGNGLVTLRDFDPASGHLVSIQSGFEFGSNIRELEYQYDDMDNVTSRHDRVQGINEVFKYDGLDRLTQNTLHGELSGMEYRYSTDYEYDLTGNILYKSDVGRYTYGSASRGSGNAGPAALTSAGLSHTGYHYDNNGNVLNGGGRAFQWTSFSKPKRMVRNNSWAEFVYGPDRARYIKRTSAGETTHYIGKKYERIEQGTTITHKHFIYADGAIAAIHIRTEENGARAVGRTRYLHTDALGSVDTVTDGFGVIVDRMGFDPFGMRRAGGWRHDLPIDIPAMTNRGFTGHEHVDEIGIIHMNGRIYDPELGRFLSADPHIQSPLNSQSHNRYSYVLNNPLKYTDPSGYFINSLLRGILKFMNRYGRVIAAVTMAYFSGGATLAAFGVTSMTSAMGVLAVATAGAVGGFTAGLITTGTIQGAFKGAVVGAYSAVFAAAIGVAGEPGPLVNGAVTPSALELAYGSAANIAADVLHGISQGIITAAAGGDFKSGFLGAFFGHSIGGKIKSIFQDSSAFGRTMVAAVVGGVSAKFGGGKFVNGAISGAFSHLYNNEQKSFAEKAKEALYETFGDLVDAKITWKDSNLVSGGTDGNRKYIKISKTIRLGDWEETFTAEFDNVDPSSLSIDMETKRSIIYKSKGKVIIKGSINVVNGVESAVRNAAVLGNHLIDQSPTFGGAVRRWYNHAGDVMRERGI